MKISVCIAAYNEEKYLSECIESVDSYRGVNELEIIIVDDFSDDATFKIATEHASSSNSTIKVLKNERKGKVSAFNKALRTSTGDCILFLGGDDISISETFDERANLVNSTRPVICYGYMETISSWPLFNGVRHPRRGGGCRTGGACWFNRAFLELYYPIPRELPNEDTWIDVITKLHNVAVLSPNIDTMRHRIHGGNSWNRRGDFAEYNKALQERYIAYAIGLSLPSAKRCSGYENLMALNNCEEMRRRGAWYSILVEPNVGLGKKMHFVFASNRYFYKFKLALQALRRIIHV